MTARLNDLENSLGFYERQAVESSDSFERYMAREVIKKIQQDIEEERELEREAEEIREEEPPRLYRFSMAVEIVVHGTYYSIVTQGWSTEPNTSMEHNVKAELLELLKVESSRGTDLDSDNVSGLHYEDWAQVPFDPKLVDEIDSRVEYRRQGSRWKRSR